MNDTSPEIAKMIRDRVMALSPGERLLMASRSFDAAREIMIASMPKVLSKNEFNRRLYERTYGEPLPGDFFERRGDVSSTVLNQRREAMPAE